MKYVLKYLLCLLLFMFMITKVNALSVDKNTINIDTGGNDKINLYANVENASKVEFNLAYSTYDIIAEFIIDNKFSEEVPSGIKHIVTFDEVKNGRVLLGTININVVDNPKDLIGNININNGVSYDKDNNTSNLNNQSITVNVNKKEEKKVENKEEIDNNLLDKIESKIVDIDIKKDVYTYDIDISEDILELDLVPIAKDSNTEINMDTQKISELKDNKIIIKTKNNDIVQDYIININIIENNDDNKIIIDNSIFSPNDSYKNKWKIITILSIILIIISGIVSIKNKKKKFKYKYHK